MPAGIGPSSAEAGDLADPRVSQPSQFVSMVPMVENVTLIKKWKAITPLAYLGDRMILSWPLPHHPPLRSIRSCNLLRPAALHPYCLNISPPCVPWTRSCFTLSVPDEL